MSDQAAGAASAFGASALALATVALVRMADSKETLGRREWPAEPSVRIVREGVLYRMDKDRRKSGL